MMRSTPTRALFALATLVAACSLKKADNPAFGGDCANPYRGFCFDAGTPAGGDASTNGDAGASSDAGPAKESCPASGAVEVCYDGEDPETALQPPCRAGTRTCANGFWGACEHQVLPAAESCNAVDDDCDGSTDEALVTASCMVEGVQGECAGGMELCVGGEIECFQVVFPAAETCDGEDEDCDGVADEDETEVQVRCYDGDSGCTSDGQGGFDCQGLCAPGTARCIDGQLESECTDDVTPTAEQATEPGQAVRDENCDGSYDEGFQCESGTSYACYTGPDSTRAVAPCHEGTQLCTAGTLGSCEGEVTPAAETCANDGTDNDCNGVADDVPLRDTPCMDASSTNVCKALAKWTCQGGSLACIEAEAAAEVCDEQDNDCDDQVDEGFDFDGDPNHCGGCNKKCAAGQSCCGGECVDTERSNLHCGGCGNPACGDGLTCCGGTCTNTSNDVENCGTCDKVCKGLLGVAPSCRNSTCQGL